MRVTGRHGRHDQDLIARELDYVVIEVDPPARGRSVTLRNECGLNPIDLPLERRPVSFGKPSRRARHHLFTSLFPLILELFLRLDRVGGKAVALRILSLGVQTDLDRVLSVRPTLDQVDPSFGVSPHNVQFLGVEEVEPPLGIVVDQPRV